VPPSEWVNEPAERYAEGVSVGRQLAAVPHMAAHPETSAVLVTADPDIHHRRRAHLRHKRAA